jgi:hypothetical protein
MHMAIEPKEKTLDISTNDPEGSAETNRPEDEVSGSTEPFKLPLAKQPIPTWPIAAGVLGVFLVIALGFIVYMLVKPAATDEASVAPSSSPSASPSPPASVVAQQQLDISKDYGNKYANNILPVGDSKYQSSGAKKGSIYACSQYATNLQSSNGGADSRGPWFTNNNTQYDTTKKPHVGGSVQWKGSFTNVVNGGTRTITTNDLPLTHGTGIFPIQSTDPAYAYDKNPNTIKAQSLTFSLTARPQYGTPQCMGGQSGVMLTGVSLFNAFDAGGRDAGAWEVQDNCGGHPEKEGQYHYHTLSTCITDVSVQTVIGFALDGFPITGPNITSNNILTTNDLDECHGTTSDVILDGKKTNTYHYVMTQDFPYSVSCFRAKPTTPPGLPQVSQSNNQQTQQSGQQLPPPKQ